MTSALPAQRYPSSLSRGQGGPSRRPSRSHLAYPIPSIDDEMPSPPLSKLPPAPPGVAGTAGSRGMGAIAGMGASGRPLNPNSKPYLPKAQRSAPNLHYAATVGAAQHQHQYQYQSQAMGRDRPHIYPDGTLIYPSIAPHYSGASSAGDQTPISDREEYSSLQHLLEQAGYADTRVHTPPAERVRQYAHPHAVGQGQGPGQGRRIKKTFDEVDADEVRDLYSTFGMSGAGAIGAGSSRLGCDPHDAFPALQQPYAHSPAPGMGMGSPHDYSHSPHEHRVTHITEPGLPLKSSSSLLRNLALQDSEYHQNQQQQEYGMNIPAHGSYNAQGHAGDHWWNGGIAALGRAALSVMSPPTKSGERLEDACGGAAIGAPASVGLGLARGGEGVRKAKSNWEMGRVSDHDQEQIPVRPSCNPASDPFSFPLGPPPLSLQTSSSTATLRERRGAVVTPLAPIDVSSPPPHVDVEEFGYSPLPADYEDQCDDDELFSTSFVGSVDSEGARDGSSSRSPTPSLDRVPGRASEDLVEDLMTGEYSVSTAAHAKSDSVRSLGFGLGMGELSLGGRIMRGAVNLDDVDFDSPERRCAALPDVGPEMETPTRFVMPRRPEVGRASTTPAPAPVPAEVEDLGESCATAQEALVAAPEQKILKYGDRATKLRMARSTPAFVRAAPTPTSAENGWLTSIRRYVLPDTAPPLPEYTSIPADPNPSCSRPAPMRLTPALPAAPAVARAAAVVCDSTSDLAEDLPAFPAAVADTQGSSGFAGVQIPLRLRPSLARVRSMFLGQAVVAAAPPVPPLPASLLSKDEVPMLSPRMDLAEGEAFAGWSPVRTVRGARSGEAVGAGPSTPKRGRGTSTPNGDLDGDGDGDGYGTTEIDYTKSFFYKPCTPPTAAMSSSSVSSASSGSFGSAGDVAQEPWQSHPPANGHAQHGKVARRQSSVKSLRKALLIPVAPPPVPALPAGMTARSGNGRAAAGAGAGATDAVPAGAGAGLATPRAKTKTATAPILAILSPGAWEAGLPARELVLEGEEWDAREGVPGGGMEKRLGRGKGKSGGRRVTKKKSGGMRA